MKKIALACLCLLLAAALFSSCLPGPGTVSQTDSSAPSGDEPVSEPSESESSDVSEDPVAIAYETVVSIGKAYTYSMEPDDKYPDPGNGKLTDGLYSDSVSYTDDHYVGLHMGGSVRVTMEMEDDYKQLYKFGISYLSTSDAGIGPISTCRVFYSLDGEKWSRTNFFLRPTYEEGTKQTAWLTLDRPVDAKYVRFELKGEKAWLFIDELTVAANVRSASGSDNYLTVLRQSYTGSALEEGAFAKGDAPADRSVYTPYQVTNGARYTTSYEASKRYPDEEDLLTNGEPTGTLMSSGQFVGYQGGEALNIDVFLNEVVDGICDFELAMYQYASLGIMLPYFVDFYVSEDGKDYNHVGRVYAPDDTNIKNCTFTLHTDTVFSALYIRYALPKTETKMFMIEEAYAAAYIPDPERPLYPPVVLETCDQPENWPAGQSSKKSENLVAGLPYQLEALETSLYAEEHEHNTDASEGVLTDGRHSPNTSYNNGYWNRTRKGAGRNVYFDLGYVSTVTGFRLTYLSFPDYGINLPAHTTLYASMTGTEWYEVGTVASSPTSAGMIPVECTLATPVTARYLRVFFPVPAHTYCDEIEIFGMKTVTSKAKAPQDIGSTRADAFLAPDPSILKGVHDAVLVYHNIVTTDEDYFLPYVAYLDTEGEIIDTMFDGYLFLPSTAALPSGGRPYDAESTPNKWSDWMALYNDIFADGRGFDALNKTVAKVKEALQLPEDYKVKVMTTLMYLNEQSNFGDCDGDGETENLSTKEGKLKVFNYAMDMYLKAFEEHGYEHLDFAGFYWFHEAADYQKDGDLIRETSKLCETKGTQLCWIPYFQAQSYELWSQLGFHCATMQPNYVFKNTISYSRLETASNLIRSNGMGIEIEINNRALGESEYTERYLAYLGYSLIGGYMKDCIHMYYQEANVFLQASRSKKPMERLIYDATYRFIKGTLTGPDQPDDLSFETAKDTAVNGSVYDTGSLCKVRIETTASHGAVTLAPNGSFVYVPYKGFTGEDTFTFRMNDSIAWTDPVTVTVKVG